MIKKRGRNGTCRMNNRFWADLLAFIEERKVIPVLGRELITISEGEQEIPLYRAVAEALLEEYDLLAGEDVVLRPNQELNDAVAALEQRGELVQDLYRPVNDLLQEFIGKTQAASDVLRDLAAIRNFDLFITTTFDDLLVNTLDDVRHSGMKSTDRVIYAPNLTPRDRRDIPEEPRDSNYQAVFYLFGRACSSPLYAIHDEDTLEFVYTLLTRSRAVPERMLSEVLNRNLLLIGCNFSDWLSRFFIRLSNEERLGNKRIKKEFLVGEGMPQNEGLTVFLGRFSKNSRIYPCNARDFIRELSRRWQERHPVGEALEFDEEIISTGEIFISYSRTDIAAAKRLNEELNNEFGAGIIWFDKGQIRGGDKYENKIMNAIDRCKLFLPLISLNTESRDEAFFRKEWYAAEQRDKGIQGRKFIIPVVIDSEWGGQVNLYNLVPSRFTTCDYAHAPDGHMNEKFRETIRHEIRNLRRGR